MSAAQIVRRGVYAQDLTLVMTTLEPRSARRHYEDVWDGHALQSECEGAFGTGTVLFSGNPGDSIAEIDLGQQTRPQGRYDPYPEYQPAEYYQHRGFENSYGGKGDEPLQGEPMETSVDISEPEMGELPTAQPRSMLTEEQKRLAVSEDDGSDLFYRVDIDFAKQTHGTALNKPEVETRQWVSEDGEGEQDYYEGPVVL